MIMKKVIVTGTSRGIGKSIAAELLKNNYKVIGIGRKHTINNKNYHAVHHDLSTIEGYKKKIDNVIKDYKKIDAVISNAGTGFFENLENISQEKILDFFNVNLFAHIFISKLMISSFKKHKKGQFIFIGSEAALKTTEKATLYAAAKHGLMGFVDSFKAECNKSNIRTTIINPGMVRTRFFDSLKFEPGGEKENAINKKDIAKLVLFILNSSPYINYSNINLKPIKKVIKFKKKI